MRTREEIEPFYQLRLLDVGDQRRPSSFQQPTAPTAATNSGDLGPQGDRLRV